MRRSAALAAITMLTAAAVTAVVAPATAAPNGPKPPAPGATSTLAEHLVGPLTFDVTADGTLVVGQDFAGLLTRISGGDSETLATGPAIAAVSIRGDVVTWGEREGDETQVFASRLMRRDGDGTVTSVDVLAWEAANNPDADAEYGLQGLDEDCLAQIPPFLLPFVGPHGGAIDSHVYGSLMLKDVTYVADAGANAVLAVDAAGDISTVAVLPPSSFVATADLAASFGLPDCVVGHDYVAEPVPTDVEMGTDGWLYVTSLPGGPEDASLGARGSVYRVNPTTGEVQLVASGFAGATGLAVAPNGAVFVAELFGDRVSVITKRGEVSTFAEVPSPAGVEWQSGRILLSTDVFADGKVVSIGLR
ncbi:ScyD/ScyE family protein [Agromyces aurantiacus]|uniref:ScyD/ScyE family protein n=1 Tax=Agromyces aurantiacus TaxID=165814 RepID=A0ABV9R6M6_9MICO|nr:ScyD/ScyE family protein [Agromyces aurantiacus]MBM7504073.1 glucose/arabinose dehydrogenase [Agromyces aurantiacus]